MNNEEREQFEKDFTEKFLTLYNIPVVVSGALKESYELLNTKNGTEVKDWVTNYIVQAVSEERARVVEKIKSMSLKSENSIDKLPEDSERNRIANLLNENMVIGYQVALNDLLTSLDKPLTDKE